MKLEIFKDKLSQASFELKISLLANAAMLLMVVVLVFLVVFKVNNEKIVLLPAFKGDTEMWVTQSQVSDTYLENIADNIIGNVLNVSPLKTPRIESVLVLVEPNSYDKVKRLIDEQVGYIRKNQITQTFWATKYEVDKKGRIVVTGILRQTSNERLISSAQKLFVINYVVSANRFYLTGFSMIDEKNKSQIEQGQK